jgi:HAD superfamily hydrolase (TIGR01493 family)
MTMPPAIVIFDLGGVLIDWDGANGLRELLGDAFSPEAARKFWLESPAVRSFESGRSTSDEFARKAVEELSLSMSPDEWFRQFFSWDRGPFPGSSDLLSALESKCELGCLSNNNELHWSQIKDHWGFGRFFRYQYLSHEIGMIKPDPEIFEYVLRDLGVPPERILYLDDNPECVEAALKFNLRAAKARGLNEVRQVLSSVGLL